MDNKKKVNYKINYNIQPSQSNLFYYMTSHITIGFIIF